MAAILLKSLIADFFQICTTFVKVGELKVSQSNKQHSDFFQRFEERTLSIKNKGSKKYVLAITKSVKLNALIKA